MTVTTADEADLVFVGFLGFLDPLKPDAADAIDRLSKLGVQVRRFSVDSKIVMWKTDYVMECRFASLRAMLQLLPPKLLAISVFYLPNLLLLNTSPFQWSPQWVNPI